MYETTVPTTIYASRVIEAPWQDGEGIMLPLDVAAPEAQLTISERRQVPGDLVGFPDETREATLRFGLLRAPLNVVVETTRWSGRTVEIGIRPPRHLPFWVSRDRYVRASYAALDQLARTVTSHAAEARADVGQLQRSA